jgi:hypothetical protein
MPLDSDTPLADERLDVKFYPYKEDGPFKGVVHVRITMPGDKNNIIDRPASEYDKQRFQRHWLNYQMATTDQQVIGTPLSQWRTERPEEISDGQLQELFILKFNSVEQLAMASDAQIQRVGMGAAGLRERARTYLSSKNAQASGAELANLKAENASMKAMMEQILAQQAAPPTPRKNKPPRRPYIRKKDRILADAKHTAPAGAAGSE